MLIIKTKTSYRSQASWTGISLFILWKTYSFWLCRKFWFAFSRVKKQFLQISNISPDNQYWKIVQRQLFTLYNEHSNVMVKAKGKIMTMLSQQ